MKEKCVRLAYPEIQTDSIVDGEGIRSVIWFQGCSHNCPGCHNPETHDFSGGISKPIEDLKDEIKELEYQTGVTFSGGDPMFQPEALLELAKCVKECGMNVWCYTGFLYEDILKMSEDKPIYKDVLKYIDVLVDGKFILALKSFEAVFRGSSNQRIIDVPASLKDKKTILVEKYR